jgi:hypothetical protein
MNNTEKPENAGSSPAMRTKSSFSFRVGKSLDFIGRGLSKPPPFGGF